MSALARRALLAGASVALAAADHALALAKSGAPAAVPPENPDAALLAACAEFQRLQVITLQAEDAGLDAIMRRRWDVAYGIEAMPAATQLGREAKARVALALLEENLSDAPDGDIRLAVSALRDLAGEGGAA